VDVVWRTTRRLLDDAAVRRAVRAAAAVGDREASWFTVVFVTDRELARMHRVWLADARPTDVITFDLGDDLAGPVGELYVSVDRARAVARERTTSPARELALYVVHGVLHLCGHDDRRAAARSRMRREERRVLAALGYEPDDGSDF
jgi:probable rRNA maturation factor